MDDLQDYITTFLSLARTQTSTISTLYSYARLLQRNVETYLIPLINRATQQPDIASIVLLLILLFISLKILNILFNTVMFWVRLAIKMVFYGSILGLGTWVYARGPEGVVEDCQSLAQTWRGEYVYWKDRAEGGGVRAAQAQKVAAKKGWF
ncbi:hypothetical protein MBLNU457_5298t1 [Dothideomycetes sp. NU457]